MLELKNLTKTYKPRKGVPIKALQGVSLSFEERGLVFILGRSGSGKSTLLNIIGGLDFADEGEIIIDGKSSKDFKRADYDAYRNQYIGFIFQEYNLLDEFTVSENIMLALELQNQKADKERLESILKEVDLEDYDYRKPSELSGGQRQRVAIARALIKNPQIIMADEPTGALDEETGIQVLETLKKLSKDKLVIVVSHDREFAEKYADRIIRLKDGKVSSDTAENLTEKPIEGNIAEKSKTKRSRLPYRYALKMGASGVWSKPLRLFITILLCMVSFAAFGVVDTFNAFNAQDMALKAYRDSNYEASAFTAKLKLSGSDKLGETDGASLEDINRLKQKTGITYVGATFTNRKQGVEIDFLNPDNLSGRNNSRYYNRYIYGYYPASSYIFNLMNFTLIGNLPEKDNEIVITKYLFDQINLAGTMLFYPSAEPGEHYSSTTVLPDTSRTAQSLIEQELFMCTSWGEEYWKIVGVLDTNADKEGKFDCLKPSNTATRDFNQEILESECIEYFRYGYHSIGYISQDRYDAIVNSYAADVESWEAFGAPSNGKLGISLGGVADTQSNIDTTTFWGVVSDKDLNKAKDIIWIDGKKRSNLNDNEYVIGLNAAIKLLRDHMSVEKETYVTHDKTYFDGIISFKVMSLYHIHSRYENYAKYIASYEEAENLEIEKLNIFKEYVLERIDAFPENTNSGDNWDSWMYPDNVVEYVLGRLYSAAYTGDEKYMLVDYDRREYDLSKLKECHWRMMYAGFLLRSAFGGYFDFEHTIYWEMEGGYNSNLTGGRCGKDIERIDSKAIYIDKKLQTLKDINLNDVYLYYKSDDFADFTAVDTKASIVGIYVPRDDFPEDVDKDTFVFNNKMYESMKDIEPEPFCFLLAPMPKHDSQLQKLVSVLYEDGNRVLRMHDGVALELELVQEPLNDMRGIILIIGLGLGLFSIMMMGNYIGTSISNKKRDIGILRALGAKASDVFAIFVNESIIIAMINAILSIIVTVFACMGLNVIIQNMTQVGFTVLFFGIRQIALMVVVSIAIAVFTSLIPIYKMSRKKPIDCIRDR